MRADRSPSVPRLAEPLSEQQRAELRLLTASVSWTYEGAPEDMEGRVNALLEKKTQGWSLLSLLQQTLT